MPTQVNYTSVWQYVWNHLQQHYKRAGPEQVHAFRSLTRAESESVEMWGWRVMHAFQQCGALVTVHEAEGKFMSGMDSRLRNITQAWFLRTRA